LQGGSTHPFDPCEGVRVSTRSTRSINCPSPSDAYVTAVHGETVRLITRKFGSDAPQDVAQDVVLTLMGKVQVVMAKYPDPVVYARVAFTHACVQTHRRNRVQRGEGSRLYRAPDGSTAPGRRVVSGDEHLGDSDRSLFDSIIERSAPVDDVVCNRLDDRHRLEEVFAHASPADRRAYFMVRGLGYPVAQVAQTIGVRRETLQRRLGRIDATAVALPSAVR